MRNFTRITLFFALILTCGLVTGQETGKDYHSYPYWIEMMQNPDANFYETQKAFYEYWDNREVTRGSGFKPFKRWEYWMEKRVSPDGTKPSPQRNIIALNSFKLRNSQLRTAGNWIPLGPVSVPSGNNGYRGMGRINAVGFHPTNENIIYAGAPSGGLWVTHDGGATWETHTDDMPTLGVSAVIVDYSNPDVVYMGTGDRDAGDAAGTGVWKSLDAGLTWQPLNTGMETSVVSRLLMHPTNSNILLAATSTGIYRTENAGLTWVKSNSGNFKDIVFKPGDPNIVYAAMGGNFYKSSDNGVSFVQVSTGLPGGSRGTIAVSQANPSYVYFFITNDDSFKGLYRSENSGASFSLRSNTPNVMSWNCNGGDGGQAWYDLDMAADPTNADVIFAGGVNCFKSSDGGLTWAINSHWYGGCDVPPVHADLHVLEYSPVNNRLYAGNDGGLYWTANGGIAWNEISNGMVISQAYKIGQSATNRNYVINGYQDNGSSTYTGPEWVNVGGGDGMECAYDPTDDQYAYSTVYYGSIDRYISHNYNGQIAGEGVNGITEGGAWVTPFVIDPHDGNIMFIGYDNIWRSTNVKAQNTTTVIWTKISTLNVSDFDVLAQSDANTDILYASSGSKFFRSDNVKDLSVQWTTLTANLPASNVITSIETSPIDENTVYIVQQNRVFKSTDKGGTWSELSNNLPDVQMNTLVYYHNSPEGLYLGTDIGVFYRDTYNPDWILYSTGLPAAARITELEIYYDPNGQPQNDVMHAGTYGRGLWESPLMFSKPMANFQADQVLVPVGCGVNFSDLSSGIPFSWEWQFEGGTPATSTEKNPTGIVWNHEGSFNVTLITTNPAGADTIVKEAYITTSGTLLPVPEFSSDIHVFCTNETATVHFYDHSEYCPNAWKWSFEPADVTFLEGTTANSQNPVVSFNGASAYNVNLMATNANGTSTITREDYVTIGGLTLPFTENWESGSMQPNGWEVINPDNSVTWDIYTLNNGSSVNKAARMNFFNYMAAPGRRDQLISPPFNLDGYETAYLGFDHAYGRHYDGITDSLNIYISDDCGTSWTRIRAYGEDGTGIFETYPLSPDEAIPQSSDDWCDGTGNPACFVIDISQFVGKANIKVMFETVHRRGNNLFIDNIFVSPTVDVKDVSLPLLDGMSLYPNPGNRIFRLEAAKELKSPEVNIYTASGKLVYSQKLSTGSNWAIKTGLLPNGLYMFRVISATGIWNEKLIVN